MIRLFISFIIFFLFSSLVLYGQQRSFSLYLIGDAGEQSVKTNGLHELLQSQYDSSVRSTVVFLGDNIYPKGMPNKGVKGREEAEAIMQMQTYLVRGLKTITYFIPGNHDWTQGKRDGWQRIKNQGAWIDSLKNDSIRFLPEGGCPGPIEVELMENVILIILDSQWFLHPWDKPEGDESVCEIKYPEEVVIRLDEILGRHQGKHVIVAAHHPIFTYSEHGGVFTFMDHIFPLRAINKNIYLPMPIIGSIYPLYRKFFGSIQDVAHPVNRRYRELILGVLEKFPGTIYTNGHEHTLQYSWKDSVHYVTSGSGAKHSAVKKKGYARFVSPANGFVRIDVMIDDSAAIQYFEVNKIEPAYRVELKAPQSSSHKSR